MHQSVEEQFGLKDIVDKVRKERIDKIMNQPGVYEPCFGKFLCPKCKSGWTSVYTFAEMGQKCAICCNPENNPNPELKELAQPTDLEPLYYFHCKNKNNKGKMCNVLWKGRKEPETQKCRECSGLVNHGDVIQPKGYVSSNSKKMVKKEDNRDADSDEAFRASHIISLCEMCRYMKLHGPFPQRNQYNACFEWPKELRVLALPEATKFSAQGREQQK